MIFDKNKGRDPKFLVSYMLKLFMIGTLIILVSMFFNGLRLVIVFLPVVVLLSTVYGGITNGISCGLLLFGFSLIMQPIGIQESLHQLIAMLSMLGFWLGVGIKKKETSDRVIFSTTFLAILLTIIFSFYYHRITGVRLTEGLILEYRKIFQENPEILKQVHDSFEVSEQFILSEFFNKIKLLLPTVTFVVFLFISTLNYFLGTFLLNRNLKEKEYPIFQEFHLPGDANLGVGLLFLTGYVFRKLQMNYSYNISVTMVYLGMILLYLQGTASILYWCRKKFRIVFGSILWLLSCSLAPWVVIFVGFFDTMFHLRKSVRGGTK